MGVCGEGRADGARKMRAGRGLNGRSCVREGGWGGPEGHARGHQRKAVAGVPCGTKAAPPTAMSRADQVWSLSPAARLVMGGTGQK